jgi:hypothetical protein
MTPEIKTDDVPLPAEYTQELARLAARAAMFGMFIDLTEPNEDLAPEHAGPFALREPRGGYDMHVPGVSIELLKEQLDQIEGENHWTRCPTCDEITSKDWLAHRAA